MASAAESSCVIPDMKNANWDVKSRIKRTNKQSLKIRKRNKKICWCFFHFSTKTLCFGYLAVKAVKAVKRTGYLTVKGTVSFSKNDS